MSAVLEATRTCKKCGALKPLSEYPWAQRTNKDGSKSRYRLRHCKDCERKKRREWRKRNAEDRRRYERQWRRQNPERAKAHDDKYNHSAKGRAARKRYEKTEKGKAAQRRYKQRIKHLTADLPIEVVRPYVLRMIKEADAERVSGGKMGARGRDGAVAKLAEIVGIPKHRLSDIAYKKRLKSVSVEDADILAMHGDFTLTELYERAEEWALLTGSKWPEGYHQRRSRRKPKSRESKERREQQVLKMLEEGSMDQAQITQRLGYTQPSAASKVLRPMLATGKIEKFREPGKLREQYRLAA